jgi:pSer/pThr/pTyr-binding forkhead associated (FHA) protein
MTHSSERIIGVLIKDPEALDRQDFPIGQTWHLTIGRAEDNEIRLTDLFVKRHHCRVYAEGDQVYLDTGSTRQSHTWVNGTEVRARCPLQSGDKIVVGKTAFRFEQPVAARGEYTTPAHGEA